MVAFDFETKLTVSSLHVLHLFINHFTHLVQPLVLLVDTLGDIVIQRLKFVFELVKLSNHLVFNVPNLDDVLSQLILFVVKLLIKTFNLSKGGRHSLVGLVHPLEVASAFLFDLLGSSSHTFAIATAS